MNRYSRATILAARSQPLRRLTLALLSACLLVTLLPRPAAANDTATTTIVIDDTNYSIRYAGWDGGQDPAASGGGYRVSAIPGRKIIYKTSVATTAITLITYRGPDQGKARILIDGVDKGTFNLYAATPEYQYRLTFSGLAATAHTIVVQALGQSDGRASGVSVRVDAFRVGDTTIEDTNPRVKYHVWSGKMHTRAYQGSYRFASTQGASVFFRFDGTQVNWLTARGPAYGKAEVYLDGSLYTTVDLYNATQQWQYAQVLGGLAAGTHEVQIRVLGTRNANSSGNTVVFDGFSND